MICESVYAIYHTIELCIQLIHGSHLRDNSVIAGLLPSRRITCHGSFLSNTDV